MSTLVKGGTQADYAAWLLPFIAEYDGMLSMLVTDVRPAVFFRRLVSSPKVVTVSGLSNLSKLRPVDHVLVGVTPADKEGWGIVAEFGALTCNAAARLSQGGREVLGFYYNNGFASFTWAIDGSAAVNYDLTQIEDPCAFAAALMTAHTGVLLTPGLEDAAFQAVAVPIQVPDLQ
jgi:hypothetical protein